MQSIIIYLQKHSGRMTRFEGSEQHFPTLFPFKIKYFELNLSITDT